MTDLKEIKNNINAVLTSGGGRLTEQQFLRDYRSLIGHIPFVQLGHKDLRSLVTSLGGFYYTRNPAGESVINAGYDEKTAHISSLIARQKKKPGSGKGRKLTRSRPAPRPMLRRPPPSYNYSQPSYSHVSRNIVQRSAPAPRSTPAPRYGNPPIVPQRTPLSAQNRLNPVAAPPTRVSSVDAPVPSKPVSKVDLGVPAKPVSKVDLGVPLKSVTKVDSGAPLKQASKVDSAAPLKASVPLKTSAQDRLSQRTVNVGAAQSRIMSISISNDVNKSSSSPSTNSKVSASIGEVEEDASYVDIQWLAGKVRNTRKETVVLPNAQLRSNVYTNANASVDRITTCPSPMSAFANGITNSAQYNPTLTGGVSNGTHSKPTLINGFSNGIQSSPAFVNRTMNGASVNPALASMPNSAFPAFANGTTTNTPLLSQEMLHRMSMNKFVPLVQQQGPVPLMSLSVEPPNPTKGKVQQQLTSKSHVDELARLAKDLRLGEVEYKYVERKQGRKSTVFIAKLKIGQNRGEPLIFSSYPDEKPTCEEAQEYVAKLACEELRSRPRTTEDVDDEIVTERVYKIIMNKSNGMVESGIVKEYENIYSSTLPVSWLEVIAGSPRFVVEQTLNGRGNAIVYPNSNLGTVYQQLTIPASTLPIAQAPKSIPSNGACKDVNANMVPFCLPKLKLPTPKDGTWDVFVASSSQTDNELWVRFIGDDYDAKYNDLMTDLEMKMFSSSEPVPDPIVDHYYCCKFDNNWLRIQLKEMVKIDGSEDVGVVFLIDNGELDTIPLSELRVIDEEYLLLPGQAVPCTLAYVDVTYEEAQSYIIHNVIGSSFVAEIIKFSEDHPKIVLHNTENSEPINININILDSIVKKLHSPKLEAGLNFVRLSHVEKESQPLVQIKGKDLSFLEAVLDDLSSIDLVAIHGVNAHPRLNMDASHVFLVRSKRCPNKWRRGVIIDNNDKRNPVIKFIDYGYEERVLVSDIFDAQKVLPPLCKYPIQAIPVSLADLPESHLQPGVVKRLRELAPPDQFLIGKVDQNTGGLRLSKRTQPGNLITSINDSILFSYEELKNATDDTKEVKPDVTGARGVQDVSTSPLSVYQIPNGIEYFNVHVSMSSNPSNFVVQPIDELNSFNILMKNMQEFYEASHHIMAIPAFEELQESRAFAAKHPEDLQWYRVSIVAAINQNMISVRYSDYGDVGLVAIDRIRYLEPDFKKMPALAIRAKLHGVKPLNVDWSVEECTNFNSLIQDNPYPSRIEEINQNLLQNSWRVSLTLIDTSSTDLDINIAQYLIEEGLAARA